MPAFSRWPSSGLVAMVEYRRLDKWHLWTCSEQGTKKETGASKAVPAVPLPPETPAGLKLNTHLAHITSYPSKIFHYHSREDIKGTVIAGTQQGYLSTLGAASVGKSSVCACVWLLLPSFLSLSFSSVRPAYVQVMVSPFFLR